MQQALHGRRGRARSTDVRSRWQEWVIAFAVVAIAVTGVFALWGQDLKQLVGKGKPTPVKAKEKEPVLPPSGPAAGPF